MTEVENNSTIETSSQKSSEAQNTSRSVESSEKKSSSLNDSTSFDQTSESGSEDQFKGPQMSEKYFKDLFKKEWKLYYRTFELNDKLYLHYKGRL
jgi:hypothetical protein